MTLGKRIAQGRTAELFEWGGDRVVKLYRAGWSAQAAESEFAIAGHLQRGNLPSPAAFEIISLEGRTGVVFERIPGVSMLDDLLAKPWTIFRHARLLAELHVALHQAVAPPEAPSQRELFRRVITRQLTGEALANTLRLLETLPDGDKVCHGDLHPANVILSPRGPVITDWLTVRRGNPVADLAQSSILLSIGDIPDSFPNRRLILLYRALFHSLYLRHYFQLQPDARREFEHWVLPAAAFRLGDGIADERQALLSLIETRLQRL